MTWCLCADIDECTVTVNNTKPCDVNEYCVNVAGSFTCSSEHCCYLQSWL